jgi:hypothetical protein
MAVEDDTRSGFSRRDALRLLAASTTTIAAGSIIVSRPAHAGNGSQPCSYTGGTSQATVRLINQSGEGRDRTDYVGIMVQVPGSCPCEPMYVEYAYSISIPGGDFGETGMTTSTSASIERTGLFPNDGGAINVTVAVRVTCGEGTNASTVCQLGTGHFNVDGPNSDSTETFALTGTCEAALGGAQAASGTLPITMGLGVPPQIKPDKEDVVDLGTPEGETTTTSSSTTTSTTEKPGNGPKDKKSDPAAATNTPADSSTDSTTTTSSSTSTTSTTSTSSTTTTTSEP